MKEFDKEKFINHCCGQCNKSRTILLEKIEQYRDSEPEMVKSLEYYRDQLWQDQMKISSFHELEHSIGEEQLKVNMVTALRALADRIEKEWCLVLHAELPQVPIFSGKDDMVTGIKITLAKNYLGG